MVKRSEPSSPSVGREAKRARTRHVVEVVINANIEILVGESKRTKHTRKHSTRQSAAHLNVPNCVRKENQDDSDVHREHSDPPHIQDIPVDDLDQLGDGRNSSRFQYQANVEMHDDAIMASGKPSTSSSSVDQVVQAGGGGSETNSKNHAKVAGMTTTQTHQPLTGVDSSNCAPSGQDMSNNGGAKDTPIAHLAPSHADAHSIPSTPLAEATSSRNHTFHGQHNCNVTGDAKDGLPDSPISYSHHINDPLVTGTWHADYCLSDINQVPNLNNSPRQSPSSGAPTREGHPHSSPFPSSSHNHTSSNSSSSIQPPNTHLNCNETFKLPSFNNNNFSSNISSNCAGNQSREEAEASSLSTTMTTTDNQGCILSCNTIDPPHTNEELKRPSSKFKSKFIPPTITVSTNTYITDALASATISDNELPSSFSTDPTHIIDPHTNGAAEGGVTRDDNTSSNNIKTVMTSHDNNTPAEPSSPTTPPIPSSPSTPTTTEFISPIAIPNPCYLLDTLLRKDAQNYLLVDKHNGLRTSGNAFSPPCSPSARFVPTNPFQEGGPLSLTPGHTPQQTPLQTPLHTPRASPSPSPRPSPRTEEGGNSKGNLKWWGGSNIGSRAENQDSFMLPSDEGEISDFLLFGVFDGHGPQGKQAANCARDSIYSYLNCQISQQGTIVDDSLMRASFVEAHNVILESATTDFGTTAVVAALHIPSAKMYYGWVGDSKAIVCRRGVRDTNVNKSAPILVPGEKSIPDENAANGSEVTSNDYVAIELTKDHIPTVPQEEERVFASGGVIRNPFGMARVFVPDLYASFYGVRVGGLNMSRSLGHKYLSRFGVIPDPDFGEQDIFPDDLIILASDGLWGKIPPKEVAQFINERPEIQGSPEKICSALIRESKQRWGNSADNITVVVLLVSSENNIT